MELNVRQDASTFAEAMGINPDSVYNYLVYFADLMDKSKNKTEIVNILWKRMETDEAFARLVLALFFRMSEDLLIAFGGEIHLVN